MGQGEIIGVSKCAISVELQKILAHAFLCPFARAVLSDEPDNQTVWNALPLINKQVTALETGDDGGGEAADVGAASAAEDDEEAEAEDGEEDDEEDNDDDDDDEGEDGEDDAEEEGAVEDEVEDEVAEEPHLDGAAELELAGGMGGMTIDEAPVKDGMLLHDIRNLVDQLAEEEAEAASTQEVR